MKAVIFVVLICLSSSVGFGATNLPVGQWVTRQGPPHYPWPGKHNDVRFSTDDGLLYLLGGDYAGPTPNIPYASGRQEMWTYSVALDQWELIQPYCRTDGTPQPSGPDEVGWTYDSLRKGFWMIPGFQWDYTSLCPNSQLVRGKPMFFDIATRRWFVAPFTRPMRVQALTAVHYDAQTDTIYALYTDGGRGPSIAWLKVGDALCLPAGAETDSWSYHGFGYSGNFDFTDQRPAFDPVGRHIYLIANGAPNLYRVNVDTKTLDILGPLPVLPINPENDVIFDPKNRVLYWLDRYAGFGDIQLYIYDIAAGTWQKAPSMISTTGVTAYGRHAAFDPYENALVVGGASDGTFSLYRYK